VEAAWCPGSTGLSPDLTAATGQRRGWLTEAVRVPIDIAETNEEIILHADLPGMKPEDGEVSIVENRLRLTGETRAEEEQDRGNMVFRERRYGHFERYIDLPLSVNADVAEAEFKNGVLTVKLPKAEEAERKQIGGKRPLEEI